MRRSETPARAGRRGSLRNPGLGYRTVEAGFRWFDLAVKGLGGLMMLAYVVSGLVSVGLIAWWIVVAIF